MAANVKFIRGQNVTLRFYQNGTTKYVAAKNWDIEANGTEVNEGVNGENRDRLDYILNGYTGSFDAYQSDMELMKAIIDQQQAEDDQGPPVIQTFAVQIVLRDGTRKAYLLQEAVVGPFKQSMSTRADPFMLNVKFRCRYMKEIQTI